MSITSTRSSPARSDVAPANVSRASSSPLSVRAGKPSTSRTRAANSAPFAASRTAEVITAAPRASPICSRKRASTSSTRCCGSSPSRPVRSTPSPSRVTIDSRASSRVPSAISRRVEFVPMSTAATRLIPRGAASLRRRARRAGCRRPCRPSASGCARWPSRCAARRAGSARSAAGRRRAAARGR